MVNMEAVQFNPVTKKVNHIKAEKPTKVGEDEVLVKVAYSGICGTDLHIVAGEFPAKESEIILGHEFSGTVEAVGTQVKHVQVGDKVVVDPNSGCDKCAFCSDGKYHFCQVGGINNTVGIYRNGGWAQYCLVPSSQAYKLPVSTGLDHAALTEPLSCLAHGWDLISPVTIGKRILIQGAGIIGNLWAAALHLQGHKRVTVTEPNAERRKLFDNLGTGYPISSPADLEKGYEADLIIDCSGAAPAITKAFDLIAAGGKICLFGVASPEAKATFSPYMVFKKELTIVGVKLNPFSFPNALGLVDAMGSTYLDYKKLGVKTYTLSEYQQALDALKAGSIAKAVFKIEY